MAWDPDHTQEQSVIAPLTPMAMEARKPIYHLKSADGPIGAHTYALKECEKDYRKLPPDRRKTLDDR